MKTIKIKNNEISKLLDTEAFSFPTYASPIINLINFYAKGTSPSVVGQMTDLIQEFKGNKIEEWEEWYLNNYPDAITTATNKILETLRKFKDVITQIDREMVEKWVKDLVIIKIFVGLKFQKAILKSVANYFKTTYRLAEPPEEAVGIDGLLVTNQ